MVWTRAVSASVSRFFSEIFCIRFPCIGLSLHPAMKKPQPRSRILVPSAVSRAQILRGRFLLAAASVFLLVVGFTEHRDATPASLSAVLMTTGGCIGLVWCGIQMLRDWQQQILSDAAALRRHATKQARRERGANQKVAREVERQQIAARAEASIKVRDRERLEHVQQHKDEAKLRSRRASDLVQEARRIASIPESEMHLELKRIWELRGWRLVSRQPLPEIEGTLRAEELLMINGVGQREVLIILTDGNRAGVSEIEMAERQRIETETQNAYLLSREGFTPQAVRLVPRFPLTLVDPHLLAKWSLMPETKRVVNESEPK